MDFEAWHIWVIVALLFAILEIFTPSFIALTIAFGCLLAAVGAGFNASFTLQLVFFSMGAALAFFTVRPFMLKFAHRNGQSVKTNVDALVGKTGRVTEQVNDILITGRAMVDGDDWRVMTEDSSVIEPGQRVEVVKVDGTILIVKPLKMNDRNQIDTSQLS